MAELREVYAKSYQTIGGATVVYDGDVWRGIDYRGPMRAGYKLSDSNWVMCIKFILPVAVKSLSFSFCNDTNGMTVVQHLRWKITSAEDASLQNATSDIPGEGTFDVNPNAYVRTNLDINRNLVAGTYYLYLWTNDSAVTTNVMKTRWYDNADGYGFVASYEPLELASKIQTADGTKPHRAVVMTGGKPVLHAPYLYTNGTWKPLGG